MACDCKSATLHSVVFFFSVTTHWLVILCNADANDAVVVTGPAVLFYSGEGCTTAAL